METPGDGLYAGNNQRHPELIVTQSAMDADHLVAPFLRQPVFHQITVFHHQDPVSDTLDEARMRPSQAKPAGTDQRRAWQAIGYVRQLVVDIVVKLGLTPRFQLTVRGAWLTAQRQHQAIGQ